MRGRLLGDPARIALEQLVAAVTAERLGPGLDRAVLPRHRLGADPDPGAIVGRVGAGRVRNHDLAANLGVGDAQLHDRVTLRATPLVELAQQLGLALSGNLLRAQAHLLRSRLRRLERQRLGPRAAQRRGDLLRGAKQVGLGEPVDVGEVGRPVLDHPQPGPLLGTRDDILDPRFVDAHLQASAALGEQLRELAPVGE